MLGVRESGTASLTGAIAAYHAALEVRTRDRVPLAWAETQNNRGLALERLGEREAGTARLEEAMSAYDAALEIFISAGAHYYADGCRNNRDRAQALLTERKH
jgi:tetratricopeptide (TPR) repeat protein